MLALSMEGDSLTLHSFMENCVNSKAIPVLLTARER